MSTLTNTGLADAAWFEAIYAEAAAAGDVSLIPWAHQQACPAMVNWLNAVAPSLIRCGARVAVVGCGTGQDARALMDRGYDVTAFDWSETAIKMARAADPGRQHSYFVADLFDLPDRWRHRFDLVVEVHTIQALPPEQHDDAVRAMGELLSLHGRLLVVCRAAETAPAIECGPPWPLTELELAQAASLAGLEPDGEVSVFMDEQEPPVMRMRGLLRRAGR